MFARSVDCVPDAMALAQGLSGRPHLTVLSTTPGDSPFGRFAYVACDADGASDSLDPLDGAPGDREAPPLLASFPRFIGVIPYEARRGLEREAWSAPEDRPAPTIEQTRWLRYPAVARVDPLGGRVLVAGSSRAAVDDLARALQRTSRHDFRAPARPRVDLQDDEAPDLHVARVERALELIRAGDLYQVNLARRIGLRFVDGPPSVAELVALHARLARAAPSPFGALLIQDGVAVISTTPELCLHAEANRARDGFQTLVTEPIKGTRPRGRNAEDDRKLACELDADPKERAELAMIIDVERNDLHRVSIAGSVRLLGAPRIVTHRTVHHRVAALRATTRPGLSRRAVLEAMVPSGSVTGAPKIRAMEVIRTLESRRRGLYTGALGFQAQDGSMTLAMAIRTAVIDLATGRGEYLVGGGIVVDSDPLRELAETRWKAKQLGSLLAATTDEASM